MQRCSAQLRPEQLATKLKLAAQVLVEEFEDGGTVPALHPCLLQQSCSPPGALLPPAASQEHLLELLRQRQTDSLPGGLPGGRLGAAFGRPADGSLSVTCQSTSLRGFAQENKLTGPDSVASACCALQAQI